MEALAPSSLRTVTFSSEITLGLCIVCKVEEVLQYVFDIKSFQNSDVNLDIYSLVVFYLQFPNLCSYMESPGNQIK